MNVLESHPKTCFFLFLLFATFITFLVIPFAVIIRYVTCARLYFRQWGRRPEPNDTDDEYSSSDEEDDDEDLPPLNEKKES